MSTNANIAIEYLDKTIKMIHTQWDGYPSHHGPILLNHYFTLDRVEKLIDLGDLSMLAESPGKPIGHSYNNPVDGFCIAYGRDRNETDVEARTFHSRAEALNRMNEYLYLFVAATNEWLVAEEGHSPRKFYKLKKHREVKNQIPPMGWPVGPSGNISELTVVAAVKNCGKSVVNPPGILPPISELKPQLTREQLIAERDRLQDRVFEIECILRGKKLQS